MGRIREAVRIQGINAEYLIAMLDLLKPIYQTTAAYGHFGRTEESFTWERLDKVEALKAAASL